MTYNLDYESATKCTGAPAPGTVALAGYIFSTFHGTSNMGIYNCRTIRGVTTRKSIHAEGRAVDVGIPLDAAGLDLGDDLADFLIEHAPDFGVQYFIWNRRSWKPDRGWRSYKGWAKHRDHIHIEQTRSAGASLTADMIDAAVTGDVNMVPPDQDPPVEFRPLVSWTSNGAGSWLLADNGDVYAIPPAPYYGHPNDDPRGDYDLVGDPATIRPHGEGYIITTTTGHTYHYGP